MAAAAKSDTIEILKCLPLQHLDEDWVRTVWKSDFTETNLIDDSFVEEAAVLNALRSLKANLTAWVAVGEGEESLWTFMLENDVSLKALVAFLAFLLSTAHKKSADLEDKEVGILAASVYLRLVIVPGSSAFKLFHPELFEKSVDLLKWMTGLGSNKRKRSVTPAKGNQKRPAKARRKARDRDPSFDDEEDDSSITEEAELVPQDLSRLRKQLTELLTDVVRLLETFSLRQSVSSGCHTIVILTQLTRQFVETFDGQFENSVALERMSVPALAFKALQLLCTQLHGNIGIMMNATCKCLLSSLLMLEGDKPVQTINKLLITIKDHAVKFILCLMRQCGDKGQTSIRTLLQHMCTKVPDRAEYRAKVAEIVVKICQEMPVENYSQMMQWFHKQSKHSQMNYRGFAIEVVFAVLSSPLKYATADVPADLRAHTSHRSLLNLLLDRCSDKAPTVRARAITCFSQCLVSADKALSDSMKEIVTPVMTGARPEGPFLIRTPGAAQRTTEESESHRSLAMESTTTQQMLTVNTIATENASTRQSTGHENSGARKQGVTPLHRVHLTPGFDASLPDHEGVFSLLRRRARDDRVNVRKVALQALESSVRFEAPSYRHQNLEVIRDHCRDPGLSVRKQCLQSLTDLMLDYPTDQTLRSVWLAGVLPLVLDRETTLQDKCMDTLEELVLKGITHLNRARGDDSYLAWALLDIMAEPHNVDQRRYLQKACHHWSRQGKIKPGLISALETHIGSQNNSAAWMLLAEIAPAAPKIHHNFLLNYWKSSQDKRDCPSEIMERMLTVMKCVAKHIPTTERGNLIGDIKDILMKFESPPELIAVSVATLDKLCKVQAEEVGDQSMKLDWCVELLAACDQYLSSVVLEEECGSYDEDRVVRHLFTLGEVVQLCPKQTPKRVCLLVQSMIATPCIKSPPPGPPSSQEGPDRSRESSIDSQSSQPCSQGTQPLSQFHGSKMSSKVRAFAFITLGKLCLQHEDLAKKCIAALARELEKSTDPAIRNNVVIVMCDLCVRYSTTANHYITNIASCVKDPSPLVRKQTVTLITRLLQEDYLKWKGALFYRFISTLLDECDEIQKFGEFCLVHMLIQRHPNMFFQHFMECVFHFNDYRNHSVYNQFPQSDKDRATFSLQGKTNKGKRQKLYWFMLEHMTDNHRFQIQDKLCQEILGSIVDGLLPLNADTGPLLKDALAILASKAIKLSTLKAKAHDEAADEQEMAAVVLETAKKNIITQVVKKNVIETIVPIVISLKHMLERERSPLIKSLMFYLRELMKDYKAEVKDILSSDRQLATEIEFEVRKFDEQLEAARQQRNVTRPRTGASPSQGETDAEQTDDASPAAAVTKVTEQIARVSVSPRLGSPKTPKMKQTIQSRSPQSAGRPCAGPVMSLINQIGAQATPNRRKSLSAVAMLNSARKAGGAGNNPNVLKDVSNSTTPDKNKAAEAGTPYQKNQRAISTPSVALRNITFHGNMDMTFLPPSPIAEMDDVCHMYDDEQEEDLVMGSKENKQKDDAAPEVLLVTLPEAQVTKPRQWNVTSPAPKGRSRARTEVASSETDGNTDQLVTGHIVADDDCEIKRKSGNRSRSSELRSGTRKSGRLQKR